MRAPTVIFPNAQVRFSQISKEELRACDQSTCHSLTSIKCSCINASHCFPHARSLILQRLLTVVTQVPQKKVTKSKL